MFASFPGLRKHLTQIINEKNEQGHVVDGLQQELESLPESYDAFWAFAKKLPTLPMRQGWPYVEPSDYEGILAECDPRRPEKPIASISPADAAPRIETAFLARVCGCVLGKPLEINPTLAENKAALEAIGEWPLSQYVSERISGKYPRNLHGSWPETVRERISFVSPDDDTNYTVLGMLILEQHGLDFTKKHIRGAWLNHLPISTTFGPERTMMGKAALGSYFGTGTDEELHEYSEYLTPREEYCGALIRMDAYAYACPGDPHLAASLAWRDASFTHRRTGIYGSMFVAAAIATALAAPKDPADVIRTALMFVPQRSRLYSILSGCFDDVRSSRDWLEAHSKIHAKHHKWDHCRVYQELGTIINTLYFARTIPEAICMQVMQGNDTDSFGATAGSLLGAYFGPAALPQLDSWLKPFNDDLHVALAWFFERSLTKVAQRMGQLPQVVATHRAKAEERARDVAAGL